MLETRYSFLFYLLAPSIVIWIFASFTQKLVMFQDLTVYQYFANRILSLIIIFVTTQLAILRIVGEREPYGTLDRDLLAISRSAMYLGKLITNALFVLLQSIFLYIVAFVIFSPGKVYGNPIILILLIFIIGLFGVTLGLTISVFAKNREQAIQFVPFAVLLLLTLSDFFFVERYGISEGIKTISLYSPLSLSYKMIQSVTADTYGFTDMLVGSFRDNYFLKLVLGIILLSVSSLLKFNFEKKG